MKHPVGYKLLIFFIFSTTLSLFSCGGVDDDVSDQEVPSLVPFVCDQNCYPVNIWISTEIVGNDTIGFEGMQCDIYAISGTRDMPDGDTLQQWVGYTNEKGLYRSKVPALVDLDIEAYYVVVLSKEHYKSKTFPFYQSWLTEHQRLGVATFTQPVGYLTSRIIPIEGVSNVMITPYQHGRPLYGESNPARALEVRYPDTLTMDWTVDASANLSLQIYFDKDGFEKRGTWLPYIIHGVSQEIECILE
jgi:hypothetical protein